MRHPCLLLFFPTSAIANNSLRKVLRRIALIRADSLPIHKLRIRIRGINDQSPICNRESLKPIAGAELAAPGAADGVHAALDVVVAGARGGITSHGVRTRRCGRSVRVDGIGVRAGGVGRVAGSFEGFDGPLGRGRGRHHGFLDWGSEGREGCYCSY